MRAIRTRHYIPAQHVAADALILGVWSAIREQSAWAPSGSVPGSLSAVSEAPASGKVSAEVLWTGASDTALRLHRTNPDRRGRIPSGLADHSPWARLLCAMLMPRALELQAAGVIVISQR
jgi:hypothetical protein